MKTRQDVDMDNRCIYRLYLGAIVYIFVMRFSNGNKTCGEKAYNRD